MNDDVDLMNKMCVDLVDTNMNLSVPWYLMASYAYYVMDDPIMTDGAYDRLARKMLEHWDSIEHEHKHYISVDMLKGGTYIGEYPSKVEGAVKTLKEACVGKSNG